MKYRIVKTTDQKYLGRILELSKIYSGLKIKLDDYVFVVERSIQIEDEIELFSYNYIIFLKEV